MSYDTGISTAAYTISIVILSVYVFSIVFGRLYTGMHSFIDCTFGVLLGATIWGVYALYGELLNSWLRTPGWSGTALQSGKRTHD